MRVNQYRHHRLFPLLLPIVVIARLWHAHPGRLPDDPLAINRFEYAETKRAREKMFERATFGALGRWSARSARARGTSRSTSRQELRRRRRCARHPRGELSLLSFSFLRVGIVD